MRTRTCGTAFRILSTACFVLSTSPGFVQGIVPPPALVQSAAPVTIGVDLGKPIGPYKPIYSWFGYDEANYTTMRDGTKLLRELHDLSPVPVSIRVHHLLTSGNGVPELKWSSTGVYHESENGQALYNFAILDGIFDAYQAAGVRPMVELGFMPKDLAAALPDRHEPYQVHYPASTISGGSNNPPKDYAKWGALVRTVTEHLVTRYGRDTVAQWYFEVWNEPDIDYWHATPEEYWKLYDYAVAGIRAALPTAKVGGPASTGPGGGSSSSSYKFLDGFLQHIESGRSAATGQAIPLDFISFHAKGHPKIVDGHVQMSLRNELADVDQGFAIVDKHRRLAKLPIILSEADPEGCAACSSKVNPSNNYRNGTLYPAYTAAAYKSLFALQDRRQVNLLAMLSWSFEFEGKNYFEGFRSLSTNGIDEPILNLFRMLALMRGDRVQTGSDGEVPLDRILASSVRPEADVDAMATHGARDAAVLLWNYEDDAIAASASPTTVTVRGLPSNVQRVLLTHFRIDDTHSNAYTVWKGMGSPQQPSAEQYTQIENRAGLELLNSPVWLDVAKGQVTIQTVMPRQSVSLLHLTW